MSVALELYVFSKRLQFADNELILLLMSCTTQHFKVLLQALALFPGMLIIIAESKKKCDDYAENILSYTISRNADTYGSG